MSTQIALYSTTWCGYCRRLKRELAREGIAYEEIDVDLAEHRHHGERIVAETGGYRIVPCVEVEGELLVNPSVEEIKAAFSRAPRAPGLVRNVR